MLHSETIVLPIKLISYSHDLHSISSSLEAFVKKSVKLKASSCSYGALIIVQWSFGCVKLRHRSTDIIFRWSGRAHQRSLSAACNKMCENLKELLNGSFEFVVWETLNESVESSFVNLIHSFTCDESFIFFREIREWISLCLRWGRITLTDLSDKVINWRSNLRWLYCLTHNSARVFFVVAIDLAKWQTSVYRLSMSIWQSIRVQWLWAFGLAALRMRDYTKSFHLRVVNSWLIFPFWDIEASHSISFRSLTDSLPIPT